LLIALDYKVVCKNELFSFENYIFDLEKQGCTLRKEKQQ
jgi:hypothetical protein